MGEDPAHGGGFHLWLLVLVCIRKQIEEVMRSKAVQTTPPWPLLQLLPSGSCPVLFLQTSFSDEQHSGSVTWINPFLPPCLSVMVFHCSHRYLNKTPLPHLRVPELGIILRWQLTLQLSYCGYLKARDLETVPTKRGQWGAFLERRRLSQEPKEKCKC